MSATTTKIVMVTDVSWIDVTGGRIEPEFVHLPTSEPRDCALSFRRSIRARIAASLPPR